MIITSLRRGERNEELRNKTKPQKKRRAVTFDLDDDLDEWLTEEKEAAEESLEEQLGGKARVTKPQVVKSKLRARMIDEKKGS